jgi:deoxyribose-phosphate aldolase
MRSLSMDDMEVIKQARLDAYDRLRFEYPGDAAFGGRGIKDQTSDSIAQMIDFCALRPVETSDSIKATCDEAKRYGFHSVAVNGRWVATAAEQLAGTGVIVSAMVGFPLGAATRRVKEFETQGVLKDGASEVDLVPDLSALRESDLEQFFRDIKAVIDVAGEEVSVKVVLEMGLLNGPYEKALGACVAELAGAAFIKTATGFAFNSSRERFLTLGADPQDVMLLSEVLRPDTGIKAAGGIRSGDAACQLVRVGATRLGTSHAPLIIDQLARTRQQTA